MIEIEEPPDIRACATCSRPLVWMWSYRLQKPVAFVSDRASTRTLHVHECDRHGLPEPSWRQLELQTEETRRAGAALARQVLASKESAMKDWPSDCSRCGEPFGTCEHTR